MTGTKTAPTNASLAAARVTFSRDDLDLIELTYACLFVAMAERSNRPWDRAVGESSPAELERECYGIATKLGLEPMLRFGTIGEIERYWQRQLRTQRQREILGLAVLLVRQHAMVSLLQGHPDMEEWPHIWRELEQVRTSLEAFFERHGLCASKEKLPVVPLSGNPGPWMTWSGDALRECVEEELMGSPATS